MLTTIIRLLPGFVIFMVLFGNPIHSQAQYRKEIDSLLTDLRKSKPDTHKVNVLCDLTWYYSYGVSKDSALLYGNQAISLADKIHFPVGYSKACVYTGDAYKNVGEYDDAGKYYDSSLVCLALHPDNNWYGATYTNKATVSFEQGLFENALQEFISARGFWNKTKDLNNRMRVYLNIGSTYRKMSLFPAALNNYLIALKIGESTGDSTKIVLCIQNIGNIYFDMRSYSLALNYYNQAFRINKSMNRLKEMSDNLNNIANVQLANNQDSLALKTYFLSLEKAREAGNQKNIAMILNNIGVVYKRNNQLSTAVVYFEQSLEIKRKFGNKIGIASSLLNIGDCLAQTGKYNEALSYSEEALTMARKMKNLEIVKQAYFGFSFIYEKKNDPAKSLFYYKLYSQVRDSLMNEQMTNSIAEMQTKYETEKKEKEILILNKDKKLNEAELGRKKEEVRKQRILIYSFVAGFLIILIFSFLLYREYAAKKRANNLLAQQNIEIRQQKEEIEAQRDEIEAQRDQIQQQRDVAEEQRDLITVQKKEITDSIRYAKRIQEAILPPEKILDEIIPDHFILFKPRDIVSGDFYWVRLLTYDNSCNKMIFCVADCTGHGVPGAFMSMLGIASLNEIVNQAEKNSTEEITAASILNELRSYIIQSLHQSGKEGESKDGMDMTLCILDLPEQENQENDNRRIQFAGANNPIYITAPDENQSGLICLKEIKGNKMPVGMHDHLDPFTNHVLNLKKGSSVYLFSDGFADQFGGQAGKKFKYAQFKDLLDAIQELSMAGQKISLDNVINEWKGAHEQTDDILIIGLKI